MHGRGHVWQVCVCVCVWQGGMRGGWGACVTGETATEAGGTHPTEMLSQRKL